MDTLQDNFFFGRDMFMSIEATIDWNPIKQRKQEAIRKSNERENSKRIHRQYKKGDWLTIQKPGILRKLSVPRLGPYKVLKHHTNGDITYEKEPNVEDKVNIRRTYPYFRKHNNLIVTYIPNYGGWYDPQYFPKGYIKFFKLIST